MGEPSQETYLGAELVNFLAPPAASLSLLFDHSGAEVRILTWLLAQQIHLRFLLMQCVPGQGNLQRGTCPWPGITPETFQSEG